MSRTIQYRIGLPLYSCLNISQSHSSFLNRRGMNLTNGEQRNKSAKLPNKYVLLTKSWLINLKDTQVRLEKKNVWKP